MSSPCTRSSTISAMVEITSEFPIEQRTRVARARIKSPTKTALKIILYAKNDFLCQPDGFPNAHSQLVGLGAYQIDQLYHHVLTMLYESFQKPLQFDIGSHVLNLHSMAYEP